MAEPIDGGVELEYNNNIYNIIAALIRPLQHVQRCYTIYIYILCSRIVSFLLIVSATVHTTTAVVYIRRLEYKSVFLSCISTTDAYNT